MSVKVTVSCPRRQSPACQQEAERFGIDAIRVLTTCNEVVHAAHKWDIDEGRLYVVSTGGTIIATYNQGSWESVELISE